MKDFYARLLVRSYQCDFLIHAFTEGTTGARACIKRVYVRRCVSDQEKGTKGLVFLHLTYHLIEPTSKVLQRQWIQHLLHPPWERPLWTQKKVTKFPFVSTRCVWHTAAQKCRQNNSHTVRLIISMGLLYPPIWSRYWGPIIF